MNVCVDGQVDRWPVAKYSASGSQMASEKSPDKTEGQGQCQTKREKGGYRREQRLEAGKPEF